MKVPVTRFEPHWYKIYIEYASWQFIQDLVVVGAGILMNTIVFCIFVLIAFASKRYFHCFPRIFFKAICWYGVWTTIDPYVVLLIDVIS
jgi:hypothetical protein